MQPVNVLIMQFMAKKPITIVGNVIYGTVVAVVTCFACLLVISAFDLPGGIKVYTVQSGSMEPTIKTGSIIISKYEQSYAVGDIITFKPETERLIKKPKITTTHRVIKIDTKDQKTIYRTKGDANNTEDSSSVSQDLILGKAVFSIPFLGYPLTFAKTQTGLIVLIVIPATIIIYNELITIKHEIVKLWKRKEKQSDEKNTE